MPVPKPTTDDKARFTTLVAGDPRVAVKPMFGNLGAFVNGNMFRTPADTSLRSLSFRSCPRYL